MVQKVASSGFRTFHGALNRAGTRFIYCNSGCNQNVSTEKSKTWFVWLRRFCCVFFHSLSVCITSKATFQFVSSSIHWMWNRSEQRPYCSTIIPCFCNIVRLFTLNRLSHWRAVVCAPIRNLAYYRLDYFELFLQHNYEAMNKKSLISSHIVHTAECA